MRYMGDRKQSDTGYSLFFMLVASADHITGLTGKAASVVVKLAKNVTGGNVAPSGAISEVDATYQPGLYAIAGNATDSNTLGVLHIYAKDAASDPENCFYLIKAFDPFTQDKTGFSLAATGADLILYTSTFVQAIKTALEIAGGSLATLLGRIIGTLLTGNHSPQSGDAYAIVNDGTIGNAVIKAYVDDIGIAGAGLTALPAMILDLANGIETGLTPREAFRYLCAFFALVSGYPGGPAVFRNAIANSKVRLTVTHDANGNRTIIVSDLA